tara:strand:- start:59 stop:1069 length:1011 start_codon:yes stop_codon:yes gene_type:complete
MPKNTTKLDRVRDNSMKFLDGFDDETMVNSNYIPEGIHPFVNQFVRNNSDFFNKLAVEEDKYDKSSDEHIAIKKEKEKVAKRLINVRSQIDKLNSGTGAFKAAQANMSEGTSDKAYFTNSSVYGNQYDALHINEDGNFNFLISPKELGAEYGAAKQNFSQTGEWDGDEAGIIKLDEMSNTGIIQEPYGAKTFVWKLAEKTKVEKDSGKAFDEKWTYNSTLNNLTEGGPHATIGLAFTDLAGDGQTKSFAKMYEEGMKEDYYTHPDTGETLPEGLLWMKDPANADVLSKLLSKYVTNIMKDMHGPEINEDTGQVKKTQSQLAQDLIKKYSHAGHKHK